MGCVALVDRGRGGGRYMGRSRVMSERGAIEHARVKKRVREAGF